MAAPFFMVVVESAVMNSSNMPQGDQHAARALGLKVPVFRHLRDSLAQGEDPSWLQLSDPMLAGAFPSPLGFELLLDGLKAEAPVARRRANLLTSLAGKEMPEIEELVAAATDDGTLEDISIALQPANPPEGVETPEKEEHGKFLEALRGDMKVALVTRAVFRKHATIKIGLCEAKEDELRLFKQFAGQEYKLEAFPAQSYLAVRRGEHAHALQVEFVVPQAEIDAIFNSEVESPPQERDNYLELFRQFFQQERLPRFVQEARARLKRLAESSALEHAWNHAHLALDRGRQEGLIVGIAAQRSGKVQMVLLSADSIFMRGIVLNPKAEDFAAKVDAFIGEDRPLVAALQADSPTRNHGSKVLEHLRKSGKVRQVLVPVAVVRTLLREVARRLEESHLTHDERQALMLARLVHCPRAAALHTPHIVRAFVAGRSEVNHHRLDTFEIVFVQSLLAGRGVDVNVGTHDELKSVPGVDPTRVEIERSTAPFMSLADFQNRICLSEQEWRVAMCFLRCRVSEEPLDARALHPIYYQALRQLVEATEVVELEDVLKDPAKAQGLDWEELLKENGWSERVPSLVRRCLTRGGGRRPRMHANKGGRLEGLEIGGMLKGKVVRLSEIGAFVDVGLRTDGFVHVSQVADQFVKDPAEFLEVGQEVSARVLSVDLEKQRFRLSLRSGAESERKERGDGRGRGRGSGSGSKGGRGQREERKIPSHAVDSRPKSKPGGGGRRDDRDSNKREKIKLGKDPQADRWKEDIDPTNPFYQFFQEQEEVQKSQGDKA